MKKQYVVFGAGRFGKSIALTLQRLGGDVMVVDQDESLIQEIADEVSYAIAADVTDPDTIRELGLANVDCAIISMAFNLEASVTTAMLCSEAGIPRIIAKAKNHLHEKILHRVGVHEVILPEEEMGRRLAKHLVVDNFSDWIDLSPEYSMVEVQIPKDWGGKSLKGLKVRKTYKINVIGIRTDGSVSVILDPNEALPAVGTLIIAGANENLAVLKK